MTRLAAVTAARGRDRRPVKKKRSVKRHRRAQPRARAPQAGRRRRHRGRFGETSSLISLEEHQRQREEDKMLKTQMQVLLNSPEYMAKAAEKWGTSMAETRALVENIRDGNIR